MWKLAIPLLLTGCMHTTVPQVIKLPVYHPAMPVPYSVCPVYWEVTKTAKVALTYNDNVTAAICARDMERYLSQLITITCHYRQELKESICLDKQ